jgi:hypothetical protein
VLVKCEESVQLRGSEDSALGPEKSVRGCTDARISAVWLTRAGGAGFRLLIGDIAIVKAMSCL